MLWLIFTGSIFSKDNSFKLVNLVKQPKSRESKLLSDKSSLFNFSPGRAAQFRSVSKLSQQTSSSKLVSCGGKVSWVSWFFRQSNSSNFSQLEQSKLVSLFL